MNFSIFYIKSIENIRQQSITVLIHCNSYSMYNQLINSQYRKILENWRSMSIITGKSHNSKQFFSAVTIKASDEYEDIYSKLQCSK